LYPQNGLVTLPPIALSALVGAYTWVVFDQLQRYRKRDFTRHDAYICSYRFIIAVPIGIIFSYFFKETIGVPLAFCLAAFPVKTLQTFSKRYVREKMSLRDNSDRANSGLTVLQCINQSEAERFEEEGFTNFTLLAYADPLELALRTNFDFNYISDCISQAILWLYFEESIKILRKFGLRSAYDAHTFWMFCTAAIENYKDKRRIANKIKKKVSEALEMDEQVFLQTLCNVAEDPHTIFLCYAWIPGQKPGEKAKCLVDGLGQNKN